MLDQVARAAEATIKCLNESAVKGQGSEEAFGETNLMLFLVENIYRALFGIYDFVDGVSTLSEGWDWTTFINTLVGLGRVVLNS